jgi:DNA invertase Pin-like site-specific DNA recombinase
MSTRERPRCDRGAAYLRVSDGGKQETESQRRQIEAWAARLGVTIVEWYIDNEGSNSRHKAERRAEFQRLLADVRAKKWKFVVVDSQDRFGTKHGFELGEFLNQFLNAGCELWSVAQGHLNDPKDLSSQLIGGIGAATSQREQEEKAHRIMRGLIKTAREGLYTGGIPPFGFDVGIYPQGDHTREKWRIVFEGRDRRVKVWPDGRRERYDGKGNSPSYDPTDEPRFVLSIQSERIEAVKLIFAWYVSEDVSFKAIAKRLNARKILSTSGKGWGENMIRVLLTNPIYKGLRSWGRNHGGDFADFQVTPGGHEVIETEWEENRPKHKGDRPRGEWVNPDSFVLPAIIDEPIWEKVQQKIEAKKTGRARTARSDALWLKPFMICDHCGRPMRSTDNHSGRRFTQYLCSSAQDETRGLPNPHGCRRHSVDHGLIERIVTDYLREKHQGFALLKEGIDYPDMLKNLEDRVEDATSKAYKIISQMMAFVEDSIRRNPERYWKFLLPEAARTIQREIAEGKRSALKEVGHTLLAEVYRLAHRDQAADLADRIARMEGDLEGEVNALRKIKNPQAQAVAAKLIDRLGEQLEELKAQQQHLLSDQLNDVYEEINRVTEALQNAEEEMAGTNGRRKTEALFSIVRQIRCRFRHQEGGGRKPNSVLESVEIVPVAGGDPSSYQATDFVGDNTTRYWA